MIDTLASRIVKHPKKVIIIALLLLIPSLIGMILTPINYDILSYLPKDLDSVKGLEILDEDFNAASMGIVIVQGMNTNELYEAEEKILQTDHIDSVLWLGALSDSPIPLSMLPDAVSSLLYNQEKDSTLMMIQFSSDASSAQALKAVGQVKKILSKQCLVSGTTAMSHDMQEMVFSEMPLYILVAVSLATVILMFTMNSFAINVIIVVSLGMAVLYNMGTNFIFGEISFVTQAIAAILQMAVTVDYSVFLVDRYTEEKARHKNREDAMKKAITGSFASLSGSSLTTVFGFLALCFMTLTLGRDIGIVMAKGVIFGVIAVTVILPAFIMLTENAIIRTTHRSFLPSFNKLNKATLKAKPVLAILFVIITIPAFIGQSKVEKYYNLLESMPLSMNSVEAMNVLAKDYNMASSHFIVTKDSIDDKKNLEMMKKIQNVDGVTGALGLKSALGTSIPTEILPESLISMLISNGYQMIMVTSAYAASTDECNRQIDTLDSIIKSYDSEAKITGEAAMYKDLMSIADIDFMVTSALSIIAIFVIIAIIFKSISVPFILVLSIQLAIWINVAISYFTGEVICFITPTIISCVQLGATVDYAILLTTRFREEIRKGLNKKDAMLIAANESHKSIFQSALVFFAATFGVYLVCDIDLIKSMCIMLARGSIISAFIIMVFLTPILVLCEGFINKTSVGWRKGKPPVQKVYIEVIEKEVDENDTDYEQAFRSKHRLTKKEIFARLEQAETVEEAVIQPDEDDDDITEQPITMTLLDDENTIIDPETDALIEFKKSLKTRTRIAKTSSTKRKDI